jgi:ParB/RepB/Spo0J family partition protein
MLSEQIREVAIDLIDRNPDQPRKTFEEGPLRELAASILEIGLQQPITVRPHGDRYQIVMGERRWRAHQVAGKSTIAALVREMDDRENDIAAIVENIQRQDLNQVEQGEAYAAAMARYDLSAADLAKKLGLPITSVTTRVSLLQLRPEYLELARSGQLNRIQAFQLSRLSHAGQDTMFQAINSGRCPDWQSVKSAAAALYAEEQQEQLFGDLPAGPSQEEREAISSVERKINRLVAMLNDGFDDGELVIARKVDPNKAGLFADKLRLIKQHVHAMEMALRATTCKQPAMEL